MNSLFQLSSQANASLPFFAAAFFIFLAGFIDSIAGGGGLITIPVLTLIVGPGAIAIGTNKILGLVSAGAALLVYMRKGHLRLKGSAAFLISLAAGTFTGSQVAMILPLAIFKWLLLGVCPVILFITLRRDSFITRDHAPGGAEIAPHWVLGLLGFMCGFYDGSFGPGGGTFMFLSLAGWGGFPILAALATSKLANTLSAGCALISFAHNRSVVWDVGLKLSAFSVAGALLGSSFASARAKQVVRPVLVVVVLLLLAKLTME
jgi:uncharacterized membrane protein YfcA